MFAKKEGILYKIEFKGQLKGYLLGTMHVRDQRVFAGLELIQSLIDECTIFYAETQIDDMQAMSVEGILNFKNGDNLKNYFSEKKFNKLNKICKKSFDVDLNQIAHLMPMTILNLITLKLLSEDMQLPLDHHLWNYASDHKPCYGLETAEEQREIFLNIPLDWQLKQLKDALRNVSAMRKGIVKMAMRYQKGELNKLYRDARKQLGGMRELMLYSRNKTMAMRAGEALRSDTCFISVGAAHLPGKKGVLRLLKKQGFKMQVIQINK